MTEDEIKIIEDFVRWYENDSGHDAFAMFDNIGEVILEYIDYKSSD